MRLNQTNRCRLQTHEGARAHATNPEQQLRRSVMSCLLWESEFYEDGVRIADRIAALVPQVSPECAAACAVEAREKMRLRHVPLLIVREMARGPVGHRRLVAATLERVIQRADELAEFLSIYWAQGREPLAAGVKKGLARAFSRFDEYQFAKYKGDDKAVKLRDVMFLCHPRPAPDREDLYKRIAEKRLETPDTWEVALSGGADRAATFRRLMAEDRLGGLAWLRNLRNMVEAGITLRELQSYADLVKFDKVLPFRFLAAARCVPGLEPLLEPLMLRCVAGRPKLGGRTVLLVDVSGSMDEKLSERSDMTRLDAACGLAILAREMCQEVEVWSFSEQLVLIPPRHGFALRDAILHSQNHSGTHLGAAVKRLPLALTDRLIVISDEQSHDDVGHPPCALRYMLNVASAQNGVGYGAWNHVDGWSDAVLDYVRQAEG